MSSIPNHGNISRERFLQEKIETHPDKVTALVEWPISENLTELRAFVGLANYYRRHVGGFLKVGSAINGPQEQKSTVDMMKEATVGFRRTEKSVSQLSCSGTNGYYIVETDASRFAAVAVLQQIQDGVVQVIVYFSRTFSSAEVQCCTTRKELAAVIFALCEFRHYLLGVEEISQDGS